MSYKRKALKKNEIPAKPCERKTSLGVWADSVLDDFWSSEDEAWQILEDRNGKPVSIDNIVSIAGALRNSAKRKNGKDFDGRVKISRRKGNLYIYAEVD